MLQSLPLPQQRTRSHWSIKVPKSFASVPPRFQLGEWVPLGDSYQLWEGVTIYGQIEGLCWSYGEWNYLIRPPEDHPNCYDIDTPYESELLERVAEMTS